MNETQNKLSTESEIHWLNEKSSRIDKLSRSGKRLSCLLLSGFLGAGKTTLLTNLLKQTQTLTQYKSLAVIVNDVASLNIDASLIKSIDQNSDKVVLTLENGCLCCSLRPDLFAQIAELAVQGIDFVVIESSGIADPCEVAQTFTASFPVQSSAQLQRKAMERVRDGQDSQDALKLAMLVRQGGLGCYAKLDSCVTVVDAWNVGLFLGGQEVEWAGEVDLGNSTSSVHQNGSSGSMMDKVSCGVTGDFMADVPRSGFDNANGSSSNDADANALSNGITRHVDVKKTRATNDSSSSISIYNKQPAQEPLSQLMVKQIEFADMVVINKIDLIDETTRIKVRQLIKALNPAARIKETQNAVVDVKELLNTDRHAAHLVLSKQLAQSNLKITKETTPHQTQSHACESCHSPHQASPNHICGSQNGVSSFVYARRNPFDPSKLLDLLQTAHHVQQKSYKKSQNEQPDADLLQNRERTIWTHVLRSKGTFWLSSQPELSGQWSQAGGIINLGPGLPWWSTMPATQWPPRLVTQIMHLTKDQPHGDRRQELVIIGTFNSEQRREIEALLDSALVSPGVVQHDARWLEWE